MNAKTICRSVLIGLLILLATGPPGALGQSQGNPPTFRQEELDQMLAPIALYPDSLLAQVLVAATYPIEVVQADRWVKQNKDLKGDRLNDALDKMSWDLSVKALVPFPQVLSMMSEKLDWTQNVGDAFLAQQADVMDSIQKLRARAQAQGSLKTTKEQKVIVKEETIVIEPASPTVVYVPAYNPAVVYGSWWYPAYPPYPYYPAGAVVAAGAFGFAAGVAVGAAWNNGWGSWNWGHHDINVNIDRNININRNNITNVKSASWRHDVNHRGNVPYRDASTRERYDRKSAGSEQSRRDFRGHSQDGGTGTRDFTRQGTGKTGRDPSMRPETGTGARPDASAVRQGLQQRQGGGAFQGMGNGREARMSADRGRASREMSFGGGRGQGPGATRGGGGFQGGGGFRGGGGGRGRR